MEDSHKFEMVTFSSKNRFASVFCNNKIMVYKLELSHVDLSYREANVDVTEESSVHSSDIDGERIIKPMA